MSELLLTVFTHPACSGCPEAVRKAWAFTEQRGDIVLRTVSLSEREGLAEARRTRVTIIPALVLTRAGEEIARWQGMPDLESLETAVAGTASACAP